MVTVLSYLAIGCGTAAAAVWLVMATEGLEAAARDYERSSKTETREGD